VTGDWRINVSTRGPCASTGHLVNSIRFASHGTIVRTASATPRTCGRRDFFPLHVHAALQAEHLLLLWPERHVVLADADDARGAGTWYAHDVQRLTA